MKHKSKSSVSIIGGADGPSSIFIAKRTTKQPLKIKIRNIIYRYKRKNAEKKVIANAHTLEELVQYAKSSYVLYEISPNEMDYIEQQKNLKEGLILQHKPDLLGEMANIPKLDISNEESVREYWRRLENQMKMISELPDSVITTDFHLYKIRIGDDYLEMGIDYIWSIFDISYSGNRREMKKFKKIARDLYLYYGVNEEDIKNKTKRYSSLVAQLSS